MLPIVEMLALLRVSQVQRMAMLQPIHEPPSESHVPKVVMQFSKGFYGQSRRQEERRDREEVL